MVSLIEQGGLSAQAYVHIEVQDLNDNAPVFNPERYVTSISGHTQPGTEILNVIATDRDSGHYGQITYQLQAGDSSTLFSVDNTTGERENIFTFASLHLDSGETIHAIHHRSLICSALVFAQEL